MNWFSVTFQLYKRALRQAFKYFVDNPIFMIIGAVMAVVIVLAEFATSSLPLFGYLIQALVQAACYSSYLYIVYRASLGYKVDWQDAKRGVYVYTRVILGVIILNNFIVIILVRFLMIPLPLILIYLLALTLLLNALPEVIACKQLFVIDSIKYALQFERENILVWYLPNFLFALLFAAVQNFLATGVNQFTADFSIKMALLIIAALLVFQFIGGIIMLFRQGLFRAIDSGDYRRRLRTVK